MTTTIVVMEDADQAVEEITVMTIEDMTIDQVVMEDVVMGTRQEMPHLLGHPLLLLAWELEESHLLAVLVEDKFSRKKS